MNVLEPTETKQHKKNYVKRSPAIPNSLFIQQIVRPIMQQVAAKRIKKNLGMTIAALCGAIDLLPIHEKYQGKTNPFQTFSSNLTRYKEQPAYDGEQVTEAKQILPSKKELQEVTLPVYPLMNREHGVPQEVINRWVELCNLYGIDHTMFTETGGTIRLSDEFLRAVAYFATDKGLEENQHIWGKIKPMSYVPTKLLDPQDLPERLRNRIPGRRPGRPKKDTSPTY